MSSEVHTHTLEFWSKVRDGRGEERKFCTGFGTASGGLILRFASGVDREINMWNELEGRVLKLGVNTGGEMAQFV